MRTHFQFRFNFSLTLALAALIGLVAAAGALMLSDALGGSWHLGIATLLAAGATLAAYTLWRRRETLIQQIRANAERIYRGESTSAIAVAGNDNAAAAARALNGVAERVAQLTTEAERSRAQLQYLTEHDPLTGLMNRRRFQHEVEKWLDHALRYERPLSLLSLDLDEFKFVNDTFGHAAGDHYLSRVSAVLSDEMRQTDCLGRLGGDEFGVLLTETGKDEAESVARRLLSRLSAHEMEIDGRLWQITASVGFATAPEHGEYAQVLLTRADIAMARAKRLGRNRVHGFAPADEMLEQMHSLVRWEDRIKRALNEDRFFLVFQPIFSLGQPGQDEHFEALLRMKDDDGRIVPPGAFLGTAERFGLIEDIDRRVVQLACDTLNAATREGRPIRLSVNLSGCDFTNPTLCQDIETTIKENDIDASRLVFEITETSALSNVVETEKFIRKLSESGCRFALDDFGAGFTSLSHLKTIPVSILKIDGTFVQRLDQNLRDQVLVKAVTDMAHAMDMEVTAEFVENEATLDLLKQFGVDHAQGFYLGRPEAIS